ncbi:hypothetical protein DWU98_09600 [Dyella monticola]|uniref:Uncharacterized protein n=1 Tax=Dyella monticola TaxID=1927958 RepID=A0A370X240_9GAMM|nr:hypothetical protein DWU98_09600 [Dyella monticola]
MLWLQGLILSAALTSLAIAQDAQQDQQATRLMEKVGAPSQFVMNTFKSSGMLGVKPHTLTGEERQKIKAALAALPPLDRRVLLDRLDDLSFIDGIPGEGTGLTSPGAHHGHYNITLRASIIDESLSTFLTTKERRDFTSDDSGITVTVKGQGTDALHYVLLHESTHVVDQTCRVTFTAHSKFVEGIWKEAHTLDAPWNTGPLNETFFRTHKPLEIQKASAVYGALSNSPFVSLYATSASAEDFAELVAWDEVRHMNGHLVIELTDRHGAVLKQWQPLTFPGVVKRFEYVDEFLANPASFKACAAYKT